MSLADSPLPDLSNKTIDNGRYRLLSPLGAGGFGVVYRALEYNPDTTQTVVRAIKVMHNAPRGSGYALNQLREIGYHTRVSGHPNTVRLHRALRDRSFLYLVMDYMPGGDLARVVRKRMIPVGDNALLKRVFLKILDGVEECHSKGVFHRDLKLENILVDESLERVCVSDFGLATTQMQSTSFNTGTKHCMSPECVDCNDVAYPYDTRRSDVWASGIILLNLATGKTSWHTATLDDGAFAAYLEDPDYLCKIFPISRGLNRIFRRVFTIVPANAMSLSELREAILKLDTFWMNEAERAAAGPAVQKSWEFYTGKAQQHPPPLPPRRPRREVVPIGCEGSPSSSDDSSDDSDDLDEGDTFASDTASESSGLYVSAHHSLAGRYGIPAVPYVDGEDDTTSSSESLPEYLPRSEPFVPSSHPSRLPVGESGSPHDTPSSSSGDGEGLVTPEVQPQVPQVETVSSNPLDGNARASLEQAKALGNDGGESEGLVRLGKFAFLLRPPTLLKAALKRP